MEKPEPARLRLQMERFGRVWAAVWVWLPVAVAVTVIALESTDTFSSEHTGGWLRPIVERLFGHFTDAVFWWGHHVLRKCGHFGGYGMVCLAFLRAWLLSLGRRDGLSVGSWRWRGCLLAVASTFCVAGLDEWHQTFIPSRTGLFSDVLLDTCGAAAMCGMTAVVCRWWLTQTGAEAPRETMTAL